VPAVPVALISSLLVDQSATGLTAGAVTGRDMAHAVVPDAAAGARAIRDLVAE
jgi:hypothetical protein